MHRLRKNAVKRFVALGMLVTALVTSLPFSALEADIPQKENTPSVVFSAAATDDGTLNPNKAPKQVNVHMGDDPSTQMNFTYSTVEDANTQVVIHKAGDTETIVETGESSQISNLNSGKFLHKISVSNLTPDTEYAYTVGYGENIYSGTFKTALPAGSKDSFSFVYLADTQVSNATNAKALGATLNRVNEMDPDFVYIAGDITDTAANETQWEQLFYNNGAFPEGGQNMFGNSTLIVTQGNHDNNTMNRHINAPAASGNIVYSFEYGPATFIILNLESARSDSTARERQKEYLTSVVNDAKARGQWTLVGFHKSLYTGASHIVDSDVIDARKYWCPLFAELDVDFVLQGHDHVYSRGFVEADGAKADVTVEGNSVYTDPDDAPLYMVGGHAGGLKWYQRKSYNVTPGDPLLTGYSFLDVNSSGIQADGSAGSEIKQEQVIVSLEVSDEKVTVNTTMFKYDTSSDTITTPEYVYDSFTVKRDLSEEPTISVDAPERAIKNQEFEITVRSTEAGRTFGKLTLFNETGRQVVSTVVDSASGEESYVILKLHVGTLGDARVLSVWENGVKIGEFTIAITVPDTAIESVTLSKQSAAVNEDIMVTAVTTKDLIKSRIVNERGGALGKVLISKTISTDGFYATAEYSIQIGTAGEGRALTFFADFDKRSDWTYSCGPLLIDIT